MSMIWRDPREAFTPLREAMNHLFEESFIWPGRLEVFTGRTFPVDVSETKDQQGYVVEASLPGAKPEDISISAMGDTQPSAMQPKVRRRWRSRIMCDVSATKAR